VEGERIHISSFSGYKLIGVKPQTDAKKISVCKRIARYLSSEVCQLERFNSVNWGPTNITALANEAVKAQPGLKALREQKPYSKAQVQCPSSWFNSVSTLAASIGADASDAEIMAALQGYQDNLESLLSD
jgi:arabinogalactan oligomer/maltooligosaccharide transport system substrate-binding protein